MRRSWPASRSAARVDTKPPRRPARVEAGRREGLRSPPHRCRLGPVRPRWQGAGHRRRPDFLQQRAPRPRTLGCAFRWSRRPGLPRKPTADDALSVLGTQARRGSDGSDGRRAVGCLGPGAGRGRLEAAMSDVILVVLERPEAAARLLCAAERLARLTGGARVNALAVRTPRSRPRRACAAPARDCVAQWLPLARSASDGMQAGHDTRAATACSSARPHHRSAQQGRAVEPTPAMRLAVPPCPPSHP
jgi:hypothetical protein